MVIRRMSHAQLTPQMKEKIIHLWRTEKENSSKQIGRTVGYTEHAVNNVIDKFLKEKVIV